MFPYIENQITKFSEPVRRKEIIQIRYIYVLMLVLGDAHADNDVNRDTLLSIYRESDADTALQVGDLLFYDLPIPTWFIAGNNEDLDVIDALRKEETPRDARNTYLLDSKAVNLDGLRITGLSGNFAPTQFDKTRSELEGSRRRHFVRGDVELAMELSSVDVFLTHEAPHGHIEKNGYDMGCKHVDTILQEVTPDLCLVGHHHEHVESTFGETKVISLKPIWEGYYTLRPDTLEIIQHRLPE